MRRGQEVAVKEFNNLVLKGILGHVGQGASSVRVFSAVEPDFFGGVVSSCRPLPDR